MSYSHCQPAKFNHRDSEGLLKLLNVTEVRWTDIGINFIMGLPLTNQSNDAITVVVDRCTKIVHLISTQSIVTASGVAELLISSVWKLQGVPESIVSERYPRLISVFW